MGSSPTGRANYDAGSAGPWLSRSGLVPTGSPQAASPTPGLEAFEVGYGAPFRLDAGQRVKGSRNER